MIGIATLLVSIYPFSSILWLTKNVVWNRELLHVGGVLARAAYQLEIDSIREAWETNVEVFKQVSQELPVEL